MLVALLAGCGRGDDGRVAASPGGSSPLPTGATGTTGATGDTATTPPATGADDCDPEVHVPVALGAPPVALPDPHAEVYGSDPAPFSIRYGWPGTDPSVSAGFVWRTDLDTLASALEITPTGGERARYEGASFRYGVSATGTDAFRIHEVKLCGGLTPDTEYTWRVGGEGAWSTVTTFRTPGAPGSFDTFRVGFLGDSRGSYLQWATAVAQMETYDPDFYVFTGDAVSVGWVQLEWDAWFAAAGDTFTRKALVPAHGNHEGLSANWFAQFTLPGNEQWYRFRYGTLGLEVLNDTVVDPADLDEQRLWLDDGLAGSDAPWKIAVHHQSPYSTNAQHGSNLELRDRWVPAYEAGGVDLVVNGHNHVYERSLPILEGAEAAAGPGVTYVVTGGAGAPLYENGPAEFFSGVVAETEHFLIVDFDPTGLHAVARDLSGNVIDEFTLPVD